MSAISVDNSGLIADALYKTNPELAMTLLYDSDFKNQARKQGARVALYRNYEEGEHRSSITSQMRRMMRLPEGADEISDFSVNYCSVIVDKMVSRIHISEISITEEEEGFSSKEWLAKTLARNNFEAAQGSWFRSAIRDGDAYVLVDPKTLEWSSEPAFDGYSGIYAIQGGLGKTPLWACKLWAENYQENEERGALPGKPRIYIIVYQPDSISYWYGEEGGSEVFPDYREDGNNVVPWPVGKVPIVTISNRFDNYKNRGESELRSAITLQDVLNRTVHSLVMASELSAFGLKWSKGIAIDVNGITPGAVINLMLLDADGNPVKELTSEMIEFLKAVEVGQFDATDIGQYIEQVKAVVEQLSQCTQTPIYGVSVQGQLSGEALKQLEIGLIGKVARFQNDNTDAIRELLQVTADIQNSFSNEFGRAPALTEVSITWKSPEILDNDKIISTLIKMRTDAPGLWPDSWYRERIGALLGMTQAKIKEAESEVASEQSDFLSKIIGANGEVPIV